MSVRIYEAQKALLQAATVLSAEPENEEAWRNLCRARATLRALARCAR